MNRRSFQQSLQARAAKEKQYWDELKRLADTDQVAAFYRLYAEYLEWADIVSNSRKAIHKMAISACKLLENND